MNSKEHKGNTQMFGSEKVTVEQRIARMTEKFFRMKQRAQEMDRIKEEMLNRPISPHYVRKDWKREPAKLVSSYTTFTYEPDPSRNGGKMQWYYDDRPDLTDILIDRGEISFWYNSPVNGGTYRSLLTLEESITKLSDNQLQLEYTKESGGDAFSVKIIIELSSDSNYEDVRNAYLKITITVDGAPPAWLLQYNDLNFSRPRPAGYQDNLRLYDPITGWIYQHAFRGNKEVRVSPTPIADAAATLWLYKERVGWRNELYDRLNSGTLGGLYDLFGYDGPQIRKWPPQDNELVVTGQGDYMSKWPDWLPHNLESADIVFGLEWIPSQPQTFLFQYSYI